jgi:predicted RNA binding protein YcfA (HicA-like mRNA interferase family)
MPEPLSRRELIRKLKRAGFSGPFSGGRHNYLLRDRLKIFIPNPHGADIGSNIIRRIIIDADTSEDELDGL